ncbi:uncharacterized protein [Engystomops pustulosus]|uniref:uncharacterized protein n=1 Tax=Engystomops pustulosus TaxID=76066 RepID=UPI003AFB3F66
MGGPRSQNRDLRMSSQRRREETTSWFSILCGCFGTGGRSRQSGDVNQQRGKYRNDERGTIILPERMISDKTTKGYFSFEEKMKMMKSTMRRSAQAQKMKLKIGIFSRSVESEYDWLKRCLEAEPFQDVVGIVRPCYITNNGFQQFSEDVSWCTFGILYHSKNRGRINVTDVTDSLYDTELQYLSESLGEQNVIVVIDDLPNASKEEKQRIKESQPSLQTLAKDVFLFSTEDKK